MSDKVLIERELLERLADIAEIEGQPEGEKARALLSEQPQACAAQSAPDEREADIRLMVDRFLSWPLPETLRADNCATMPGYPHRTGTNLMNADEAKQMLEHVISGANRHAEMESVELGMKLPCEVKLPGGMTIGKGCTLSTLLLAMRSRSDDEPWRQRFGVPVPFDPSLINLANSIKRQAKPNEQAEREAFEALRDCKGFDYFDGAYWLRAITEVPDEKALINADWELWQAATAWQRAQSAPVVPDGLAADLYEIAGQILDAAHAKHKAVSHTLMAPVRDYTLKDAQSVARINGERLMGIADRLAAAPAQPAPHDQGEVQRLREALEEADGHLARAQEKDDRDWARLITNNARVAIRSALAASAEGKA